jgi:hypothetical protein
MQLEILRLKLALLELNNFDMVRIYSKIPTQSTDAKASLGMYYLDVVDPFGKPSRPTVEYMLNF